MLKLLTPEEKKTQVKDATKRVENGEDVYMSSSSYSAATLCIGDFREIGWSKRCVDRGGMWYMWKGPTAIYVDGTRIEPGENTEYSEMDWT